MKFKIQIALTILAIMLLGAMNDVTSKLAKFLECQ